MTVAEVDNPRKSMAKAVSRIFYRIAFFYICVSSSPIIYLYFRAFEPAKIFSFDVFRVFSSSEC